jgi:hypothetical protein
MINADNYADLAGGYLDQLKKAESEVARLQQEIDEALQLAAGPSTLKELALGHFLGAKAADERDGLLAREAELGGVLTQCAEWFEEYAKGHEAKGAVEKAQRNWERAARARTALHSTGERHARVIAAALPKSCHPLEHDTAADPLGLVLYFNNDADMQAFCDALKEPTDGLG